MKRASVSGSSPFHLIIVSFLFIAPCFTACGSSGSWEPPAPFQGNVPLEREDFTKISENGFGDPLNSYAWAMAWFKGRLYVGTGRDFVCIGRWIRTLLGVVAESPLEDAVECPDDPLSHLEDFRAEIWRFTPGNKGWERVYTSPLITVTVNDNEFTGPRDFGYRGMTVTEDAQGQEMLLVGSFSFPGEAELLISYDGESFQETDPHVPWRPLMMSTVTSFRSIVPFKGKLYTTPASTAGGGNISEIVRVLESDDPASGIWRVASRNKFRRSSGNVTIFELGVFNDHLYAGTGNAERGFQLWKTDAQGDDLPYDWTLVVDRGANRGPRNEGAISMYDFKGHLYVGSGIQHGGYDYENNIGPAGAELIRVSADDTWELVVGSTRQGPDGTIEPISGLKPGFGHILNGYMWRMCVYNGWLYLGTYDNSVYLPYLKEYIPEALYDWVDRFAAEQGGFDLWKTSDGVEWEEITHIGFGNRFNYGVRTLSPSPLGLFLGTANPFKDKEPLTGKPRAGGLEIWLGN